ncbi:protein of unknown function (plasmid) [Pseudorhizobium banfieldiae]|uniref:Uncharacterized protein n=1 Tax=Pseudorhizobium banfieldiae TaxID=1125847 RepID=L0NM04_9HYPH|nr:protein of unknown function [Pseudorhizobium banfieldiae]
MAAAIGGGRFNLGAPQALASLSGTILGVAVLAQVDRVGSWQIAQQEAGLARLHHFKANIRAIDEALADKAFVLVSIDFNAADMLAIDQAGEEPSCLDAAPPYRAIPEAGLIALTSINSRNADPLLTNAEGVSINHPRLA